MKNKRLLKILSLIIAFAFTIPTFATSIDATIATNSNVNQWPYYNKEILSKAAYVMDADSSFTLFEKNADKRLYPASLTKIMTAIIVIEKSNGNYDDLVTFSYNSVTKDIDRRSVTIGASAGDQLSVKDCLYCLLLPSANDAANALAEHFAGSINDFVALMNEKVSFLGLKNTHFVNPSGLHDDNQYTSAYDMAKILQCAMSYPIFLQISSSISYTHAPIRKYKDPSNSNNQVLNTNSIMVPGSGYYYNGITSGKTGHTELAGYNLAASAKKHGMHLICVLLGSSSDKQRYGEAKDLFDFHFENYRSERIIDIDDSFSTDLGIIAINDVELIKGLNITCSENAHITLPKIADIKDVTSKQSFQVNDIYNKYAIGVKTYYLDGKIIGSCSLEGKANDKEAMIFTSHLDLSKAKNDVNIQQDDNPENQTNIGSTALIYKDSNGKIKISNTLLVLITIMVVLLATFIFIIFIISTLPKSTNIPINKIRFRIRRMYKK